MMSSFRELAYASADESPENSPRDDVSSATTPTKRNLSRDVGLEAGEDSTDDDESRSTSTSMSSRTPRAVTIILGTITAALLVIAALQLHDSRLAKSPEQGWSTEQSADDKDPHRSAFRTSLPASALIPSVKSETPGATLYCFMVMLPFGNEPKLIRMQYENHWNVFACDGHAIFSNESLQLSPGHPESEMTTLFPGAMKCDFNTWTWPQQPLALNTAVFVRAWTEVFKLGDWRKFDWTVKVDPDTVFLPNRLADLLATRALLPVEATSSDSCEACRQTGQAGPCSVHAQWFQKCGLTCPESLKQIEREPPVDCGCKGCGSDVCRKPTSVYLRNCAVNKYNSGDPLTEHAMHGPLEVLSYGAMLEYEAGLEKCVVEYEWSYKQWGEDWFLEHCLQFLEVNPVDDFESLKDGDCMTVAWPCKTAHAAFQPFKTVDGYKACYENADREGEWPPTDPQIDEHKFWDWTGNQWRTWAGQ